MNDIESVCGEHFDAAIVGGGVAGSMAALLCARQGLKTLLLERHRFPRHKVCGGCLNGRAIEILRREGLAAGLARLSPTTTASLSIRCGHRRLELPMPPGMAVSRRSFDQWLMHEALNSGCVVVDNVTAALDPLPCELIPGSHLIQSSPVSEFPAERVLQLHTTAEIVTNESIERHVEHRSAIQAAESKLRQVSAKIVLVCDGLGHPSLQHLPGFRAVPQPGSRIGLGAVFARTAAEDWMTRGEILMAVAPFGYAGIVEVEEHQLNLAAAIDPSHLQRTKSPLVSLQAIFDSAGVSGPQALGHAVIKGTVPLTRTAARITGHRFFLLGDATGYVEPFTGEGMAWALTAATAIIPLVTESVRSGWSEDVMVHWQTLFNGIVSREQSICRLLAATLKRPWLLPPVLTTCRFFPSITRRIVRTLNRVPEAMESPHDQF